MTKKDKAIIGVDNVFDRSRETFLSSKLNIMNYIHDENASFEEIKTLLQKAYDIGEARGYERGYESCRRYMT